MLYEKKILDELERCSISYQRDYPLAKHSSFKVGGRAKIHAQPSSLSELKVLQKTILENNASFFFLGGGSNLLISDKGFDGIVISLSTPEEVIVKRQTKNSLWVRGRANCRSAWFAKTVSKMGYTGLEFLSTIPGQLGGAVIQNAGCYGSEIKDTAKKIFAVSDGDFKTYDGSEAQFSYRNSIFKKNAKLWVYAVDFQLSSGNMEEITRRLEDFQKKRVDSQPKNRKSAGSIFKNPDTNITELKAWQLIERVNLRGKTIGGASWSEEHSNFIVNLDSATASDIYKLICLAEETVKQKLGIKLEKEIIPVGNFT